MKHDALIELCKKDWAAFKLLSEAYGVLTSLAVMPPSHVARPDGLRPMLPAGHDQFVTTLSHHHLHKLNRQMQGVYEAAAGKWRA